jgi:hypothetical protein
VTLGEAGADPDDRTSEIDIPPPQREQLAATQPSERRCEVERRILLACGRAHEGMNLLR